MKLSSFIQIAILFSAAVISGCGVKHEGVPNAPPVIEHDAKVFSVAYGDFKVSLASMFFFPRDLSDQQATDLVSVLFANSKFITADLATLANLGPKISALKTQWNTIDCVTKYAVLGPNDDPMDVDTVSTWKADKDVADANALQEMGTCKDNQATRQGLDAKFEATKHEFAVKSDEVGHLLDVDVNQPVNSQSIDFAHMQLKLNADNSVVLSLPGFMTPSFSPSTSNGGILNASYDARFKVLSFDIPVQSSIASSISSDVESAYLHFSLERLGDMGVFGAFTGEMTLISNGVIRRHGQAVIYFTPPTE